MSKELLGYRDDSPYRTLPEITIPGGDISMENVSTPLMLYPNNGPPQYAAPNSGRYSFPGASHVREVPLNQYGGNPLEYQALTNGLLNQYSNLDFVQRVKDPKSIPALSRPNGYESTHSMRADLDETGQWYVYPSVVNQGGKLVDLGDKAFGYARESGERIPVNDKNLALYMAEDGYKNTPFAGDSFNKQYGGYPINNQTMYNPYYVPHYQQGGEVQEEQQPVPIQTEKGEMIMFPDGLITDVQAKKRHTQMGKEQVTDILPQGAYIASTDKAMRIRKKEADQVLLGATPIIYEEGTSGRPSKEIPFSDIMNKNTMKPAELARRVKSKYPISTRINDPFSEAAANANKQSRLPYIEGIKYFTEQKNPYNQAPPQMQYGGTPYNISMPSNVGMPMNVMPPAVPNMNYNIPQAQGGGLIGAAVTGIGMIGAAIAGRKARKRQEGRSNKTYEEQMALLDAQNDRNTGLTGRSYASLAAGQLAQDPSVKTRNYRQERGEFQAMREGYTPGQRRYVLDNLAKVSSPYTSQMAELDPRTATMQGGAFQANTLDSLSNASQQMGMEDINLYNQKRNIMATSYGSENAERTAAQNQMTQNKNVQYGNLGNTAAGYYNQTKSDQNQYLAGQFAGMGQRDAAYYGAQQTGANVTGAGFQAAGYLGSLVGQGYNQWQAGQMNNGNPGASTPTFNSLGTSPRLDPSYKMPVTGISLLPPGRYGGYPGTYKYGGIVNPYK